MLQNPTSLRWPIPTLHGDVDRPAIPVALRRIPAETVLADASNGVARIRMIGPTIATE
jgi:hypothetical protein